MPPSHWRGVMLHQGVASSLKVVCGHRAGAQKQRKSHSLTETGFNEGHMPVEGMSTLRIELHCTCCESTWPTGTALFRTWGYFFSTDPEGAAVKRVKAPDGADTYSQELLRRTSKTGMMLQLSRCTSTL